jgi:hypothetical protein
MRITFETAEIETYQAALRGLVGFSGDVTTEGGEEFPAILLRLDPDAEWANEVVVRKLDEMYSPIGEELAVRIATFSVY